MLNDISENVFFENTPKHRGEDLALWFIAKAFKNESQHTDRLRCLIQDTKAVRSGFIRSPIVGLTLMRAMAVSRKDIILTLVSEGASVNMMFRGVGMIHEAVKVNNSEMLTFLLSLPGIEIDLRNVDGRTALMEAMCGKPKCVQILLEAGSNMNLRSIDGSPILHIAAQTSRSHPEHILQCLDILVDHGVDINCCDRLGRTCLFMAVEAGNRPVVRWLIEHNCDLNKAALKVKGYRYSWRPVTPFLVAVRKADRSIVATLLACGCQFGQYRWVLEHSASYRLLNSLLEEAFSNPKSLQSLCRNLIRTHLSKDVMNESEHLGLPKPLQRFVRCEGELQSLCKS